MESQMHRSHGSLYDDPLRPAGTDVHGECDYERGGETKSAMKKVKAKVEKLKAKVKHGHGRHDGDDHDVDTEAVNDSPPVRSGMVQPTFMGTPVLAEDLYATHSDIVDPSVRSFAQWEEEERQGAPPPLSTGYGTHLTDLSQVGDHGYGQDVNREQLRGSTGKSTGMEEPGVSPPPLSTGTYGTHPMDSSKVGQDHGFGDDVNRNESRDSIGKLKSTGMEQDPSAPNLTKEVSPANYQTKVTDPTNKGGKEAAGITDVLKSFDKMGVYDEPHSKSSKSDKKKPEVYTESDDQFAPEPVENPPLDTIAANPSNQSSSYAQKVTSATSAIADKAMAAKDLIVSKLGSSDENKTETSTEKPNTRSSFPTDFAHKVAGTMTETLVPVYEKVMDAKSTVMSKIQGTGDDGESINPGTVAPESKKVTVREYLVDTFRPGDEDKVLSETITNVFHRGKGNVSKETTTYVRDEGERRLQESSN